MATLLFIVSYGSFVGAGVWARVRLRQPAARRAALVILAALALPAALVLGGGSAMLANDFRLARFAAQLERYPLPQGARLVSATREVGVLTGNGNHCDFIASRVFESRASLAAVASHYAGLHLEPALPGQGGAGAGLPTLQVERDTSAGPYAFVVRAIDAPYAGSFDPRCH